MISLILFIISFIVVLMILDFLSQPMFYTKVPFFREHPYSRYVIMLIASMFNPTASLVALGLWIYRTYIRK